ncbi:hypothetical protein AQS8620_00276 [Aquimixticola soesokkakensis]|uniref:Chain length determinant protein n=1 Tax=Aquimixticola soesokkakensis TaxID=1519096 RepID=A0A1Y5RE31_9RHOB|nr:hypothetical protein [Aquimixticola soesokkakensis]SLN15374.1 hypothetical protein AQS8620_00276 [Aquimixticola soesokkakensis]
MANDNAPGPAAQPAKPAAKAAAKPAPAQAAGGGAQPAGQAAPAQQPPSNQRPNPNQPPAQKAGPNAGPNAGANAGQPPRPAPSAVARLKMAGPAQVRSRHRWILGSFLAIVALPALVIGLYLWLVAEDQFASTVGFSVRSEESTSALDILGGLTSVSGSSSSDMGILYEYLRSQELIAEMNAEIGIAQMWAKPEHDFWFAFRMGGTIEDLMAYWQRMIEVQYDSSGGLIEVRVLAFAPEDATLIAQTLFEKCAQMVNELSAIGREDSVRYAREDLNLSLDRLKEARSAMTLFRNDNLLVDPTADAQLQISVIATLSQQLTEARVELELLRDNSSDTDPRVASAQRRVDVIEQQIAEQRGTFRSGQTGGRPLADIINEYEGLQVDHEFAQTTYLAALTAYDSALAEAQRKSRYLGAYVLPTLAERAQFPQRGVLLALATLFLFLTWSIGLLISYSLRDRK